MEEEKEKKFVCKFCSKTFPSRQSLGGHIRIHSHENSIDSDRYNNKKKKRLVDQREKQQRQEVCCRKCGKEFVSYKALTLHMACHSEGEKLLTDSQSDTESSSDSTRKRSKRVTRRSNSESFQKQQRQEVCCRKCGKEFVSYKALTLHMACHSEGEKMLMDSQSDIESSSNSTRKRSKRVMRRSNSESFSNGSLTFASEIDQEAEEGAHALVMAMIRNLEMNSLGEPSDNNSVAVETKSSSGEDPKILNVKNQEKVIDDDQLRSADDNGSYSSDSDYFLNGPKKSDSDISVDGSLRDTGFGSRFNNSLNRFNISDERRSKDEQSKSKRVLLSYETASCADTNSKIHRSGKSPTVKKSSGAKKKSKGHECPICFRVFKSGPALGGHKRIHSIGNQQHNQVSEIRNHIDLNVPATDSDE